MKNRSIQTLAIALLLGVILSNYALAQENNYSALVVEQVTNTSGLKSSFTFQVNHYTGNKQKTLLLEQKDEISINDILDNLNKLDKEGWELIEISHFENLKNDDVTASFSGTKTTKYHQYVLKRKE